jgi:hypothetical protein
VVDGDPWAGEATKGLEYLISDSDGALSCGSLFISRESCGCVSERVLFDINLKSQATCPESPTMATHAVILYPSRILNCILRLIADWLMGKEEVQHGSLHDSGFL